MGTPGEPDGRLMQILKFEIKNTKSSVFYGLISDLRPLTSAVCRLSSVLCPLFSL
jgi:hypothetical protein